MNFKTLLFASTLSLSFIPAMAAEDLVPKDKIEALVNKRCDEPSDELVANIRDNYQLMVVFDTELNEEEKFGSETSVFVQKENTDFGDGHKGKLSFTVLTYVHDKKPVAQCVIAFGITTDEALARGRAIWDQSREEAAKKPKAKTEDAPKKEDKKADVAKPAESDEE